MKESLLTAPSALKILVTDHSISRKTNHFLLVDYYV